MTQHERFRRIEPARADRAPESQSADRGRIAAVIDASPASLPPDAVRIELASGEPISTGDPFELSQRDAELADVPSAPGAPDLAIDTEAVSGQPFVRCARCGCDSTIHAKVCDNCAAPLDTAEQRSFNDRLWSARQLESARERQALAKMAEARAEHRRTTVRPIEPDVAPPAELLEPASADDGPMLFWALRGLQKKERRWAVAAASVCLPLLLVTLGGPILSALGWVLVLVLGASLVPRRAALRWLQAVLRIARR